MQDSNTSLTKVTMNKSGTNVYNPLVINFKSHFWLVIYNSEFKNIYTLGYIKSDHFGLYSQHIHLDIS